MISRGGGKAFEIRGGRKPIAVPPSDGEASYVITNRAACMQPPCASHMTKAACTAKGVRCEWTKAGKCAQPPPPPPPPPPDTSIWRNRTAAAYGAVAKVDGPTARWIYQGYALGVPTGGIGPCHGKCTDALARLRSFTSPVPEGQFILLDMSEHGSDSPVAEWRQWGGQWGVPFIWTSLYNYGGTLAIKGNLSRINTIPWDAPPLSPAPAGYDKKTQAVGVGYTPEGLDQNPAYFELLQEAAFKAAPEPNVTEWLVTRAHRRYGLFGGGDRDPHVAAAWGALAASGYAIDKGTSTKNGVCFMDVIGKLYPKYLDVNKPGSFEGCTPTNNFNGCTPSAALCLEWRSWGLLNDAAPVVAAAAAKAGLPPLPETFRYDVVNIAREVLAQLSTPLLLNFTASFNGTLTPAAELAIRESGERFIELLSDMDSVLATDTAFMLGPWLASARKLGGAASDCVADNVAVPGGIGSCADFMEWNAKAQLTTWYPVLGSAAAPRRQQGTRDHDYARKHWSGLLKDVYIPRARLYQAQALRDAAAGRVFNKTVALARYARQSYEWQTDFGNSYPTEPVGDAVRVSRKLREKYARYFSSC